MSSLEIILVNDASKDATLGKLLLWEMKYPDNICVIPLEENGDGTDAAGRTLYIKIDDIGTPLYESVHDKILSSRGNAPVVFYSTKQKKYFKEKGIKDKVKENLLIKVLKESESC